MFEDSMTTAFIKEFLNPVKPEKMFPLSDLEDALSKTNSPHGIGVWDNNPDKAHRWVRENIASPIAIPVGEKLYVAFLTDHDAVLCKMGPTPPCRWL